MFTGQYSPAVFFKLPFYVTTATLIIIYYISQYYHHEQPFPHCWISACAQHYPEYVFFRVATISGPVLIALGWMVNCFYLRTICRENVFRVNGWHLKIPMILGIMGSMLLMGSTANIDTGVMDGQWHGACASAFFIFTLIAQLYNTVVGWLIYEKIKTISVNVLYFKVFLIVLLVIQLLISSAYGTGSQVYGGRYGWKDGALVQVGNWVDIFLEWTLTVTVLLGYYAIALDLHNFDMVYRMDTNKYQITSEIEVAG